MSNILITGMTAMQVSNTGLGFASLLASTLSRAGHNVHVLSPSVLWTIDSMARVDHILVGIAPVTALSANRTYGALSIISNHADDPRLKFFIEAPNPGQITQSLSSIIKTPTNLTKPFYSYRKEYAEASESGTHARLHTAIQNLATKEWPATLYPRLPWNQENPEYLLPEGVRGHMVPVNLDTEILKRIQTEIYPETERWVADDDKSKWRDTVANTLSYPVVPMKSTKFSTDADVDYALGTSIGALISPTKKNHTWWSSRYAQAINMGIPVVTEWRDSTVLGPEWAMLAAQIEDMTPEERSELAEAQRVSYARGIGWPQDALTTLNTFITS